MARSSSSQSRSAWSSDPQSDMLVYRLLGVAEGALAEHFAKDDSSGDYIAWLAETAGRRTGSVPPRTLTSWEEGRRGKVALVALPHPMKFSVTFRHAGFSAEIAVTYNHDDAELLSGTVTRFSGSVERAIEAAGAFIDEIADFDPDDIDLGHLDPQGTLFGDLSATGDGDDAPRTPSEADAREVARMARILSGQFAQNENANLSERDRTWLEDNPQCLWAVLDGARSTGAAERADEHTVGAWRFLLSNQLELIRYRSERGWAWADAMLDEYQQRIMALTQEIEPGSEDLFPLVSALNHAKVSVKPELSQALMETAPAAFPGDTTPQEALETTLRPLIADLANHIESPFEAIEALQEVTGVAPLELRSFLAIELALSPQPVLRDTVPLMLLDERAEVRRAAAAALEQTAAPDAMSSVSLRRIIAIRNWIPEADRAGVDQAIRKARSRGVEIAQWDKAGELGIHASSIDGSGAQSIIAATRSGRTGLFCGLLLKQRFGLRDAWCSRGVPRRDIANRLAEVQRQIAAPEVDRSYADLTVQHHIAVGLANGNVPGPALLDIAEAMGTADWKDRALDLEGEAARLFAELPATDRSAEAIRASLKRSGDWMDRDKMADSWFEDDAAVREVARGNDPARAAEALLRGPLEENRRTWSERFLLMALWSRAVKGGQGRASSAATLWRDFAVLAHELLAGRKLSEVPVMAEVAQRTVMAANGRGW